MILNFHEAADCFPLLTDDRFDELVASIGENGLREPIMLCDGKILDGRNRYRACEALGIEPKFRDFIGGDPFQYVWDLNGQRRDLTKDQRYLIWKSVNEKSVSWQAEQNRLREEANRKRSEAASQGRVGRAAAKAKEDPEFSASISSGQNKPRGQGSTAKATASHTNRGTVERMDRLANNRPDLAKQVVKGEIKATEAMRQMRKDEVAHKVLALPEGKYRVIYADPPWSYGNSGAISDNDHYSRVERHYPSMPLADICALNIKNMAADDAVLFLWVTAPLLFDADQVIRSWGFKYKSHFVWDKVKHNYGHYNSVRHELLIICTRGSCTPDIATLFDSVQEIERSSTHSEKPDEFRKIIDTLYPHGQRIELFRRGDAPAGWDVWGAEAAA